MQKPNHDPNKPNFHLRRAVAAGALGIVAFLGIKGAEKVGEIRESNQITNQTSSPDAMENFRQGNIDPSKVTVIEASKDSTAGRLANDVNGENRDWRELASVIDAQDGANGVEGVQNGEDFVVPTELLDETHRQASENVASAVQGPKQP